MSIGLTLVFLPTFQHPRRRIEAVALDPTSSWAVVACQDASLHILPIGHLMSHKTQLSKLWKTDDLTEITLTARKGG